MGMQGQQPWLSPVGLSPRAQRCRLLPKSNWARGAGLTPSAEGPRGGALGHTMPPPAVRASIFEQHVTATADHKEAVQVPGHQWGWFAAGARTAATAAAGAAGPAANVECASGLDTSVVL